MARQESCYEEHKIRKNTTLHEINLSRNEDISQTKDNGYKLYFRNY